MGPGGGFLIAAKSVALRLHGVWSASQVRTGSSWWHERRVLARGSLGRKRKGSHLGAGAAARVQARPLVGTLGTTQPPIRGDGLILPEFRVRRPVSLHTLYYEYANSCHGRHLRLLPFVAPGERARPFAFKVLITISLAIGGRQPCRSEWHGIVSLRYWLTWLTRRLERTPYSILRTHTRCP